MPPRSRAAVAGWMASACAALLTASAARAQALQISPILIQFVPGQMTTTLAVTNKGSETAALQIRPFQWTESGNKDVLQPTQELVVSPPITEIDAGETQTFRLLLRHPPTALEASYRLLLDQLPPPASPGTVRVALRFSIPVFAKPATRLQTGIDWRVATDQNGSTLFALNRGGEHVRILNPELTTSGLHLSVQRGSSPYILSAAERSWRIEGGKRLRPGVAVRLTAMSDTGPVDAAVHVSGP